MPQTSRFRWQLLVCVPCLLLGGISVLCGMIMSAAMTYGYARYGYFPVNPESPSMNQIAITFENVLTTSGRILMGGILLGVACWMLRSLRKAQPLTD